MKKYFTKLEKQFYARNTTTSLKTKRAEPNRSMTSPSFYVNEAKKCKCKQIVSFLANFDEALVSVFAAITVASDKLTRFFALLGV